MGPTQRYNDGGIEVWHGDAREVAAMQEAGAFSLAILDGAYGCGKSKVWDDVKIPDLPAWYAPHLDDVDRLCAPSASLYLWNTAEGWATLHPGILARGWTFRSLVTWNKGDQYPLGRAPCYDALRTWRDITEVCGFYQREAPSPFPDLLTRRREVAGLGRRDLAGLFPSRTGGLTGCVLNWEQGYNVPTRQQWVAMMERIQVEGRNTMPARSDAEYDHLRAEYEASRPAFTCPVGVSNVWTHGQVSGVERLKGADGQSLHPCQKPLAFAERMIRASTRPGEAVWAPFGGTCREAIAGKRIARADPEQARRVVTAEIDLDGRDYLGAVCRVLRGEGVRPPDPRQPGLFG